MLWYNLLKDKEKVDMVEQGNRKKESQVMRIAFRDMDISIGGNKDTKGILGRKVKEKDVRRQRDPE